MATWGTGTAAPRSAGTRAEVWVRAAGGGEWHLAAGRASAALCGRRIEDLGRWVWPLHDEETGPPPADQCVECADTYTRETGRLPLA